MARSVTFNGITRFTPGGITRINAAALNQVVLSANSIVGIIGESEGGAPGATGGLVSLFDPARAADLFRSGPIVDALGLVFQSSNDPDVPGGASGQSGSPIQRCDDKHPHQRHPAKQCRRNQGK